MVTEGEIMNLYDAVIQRESIKDKELTNEEISKKTAEMLSKLDIDSMMDRLSTEIKKAVESE